MNNLGWKTGNPATSPSGQVYAQGEFYHHDSLLTEALGKKAPENIVVISDRIYGIVEAKAKHSDLNKALKEAREYCRKVNAIEPDAAPARFATGIAGSPEQSFYVTTDYWDGTEWNTVSINNYKATGFLSPKQCQSILKANNHQIAAFKVNLKQFMEKATAINQTLHDNEIPVGDRARIVAALLLALLQDDTLRIDDKATVLMRHINGHVEDLLKHHGKADFAKVINLEPPVTERNHKKFRKAIVDTLQHLRDMNIRSTVNSDTDALGQFYETFLKYANGAKEMGIVLTPRHITKFAVKVVGIKTEDRVFDPACGTGGFLVSAMEKIRGRHPNKETEKKFLNDHLYGVEQRDDVYGLAVVNMIFRGDGKSKIYDGNCFDYQFWSRNGNIQSGKKAPVGAERPFTRVLMNPPFKLTQSSETAFVDCGLSHLKPHGILFTVLPRVVVAGKKEHMNWRNELVKRHTVKACIKFDKNLFYPVQEATYGLILLAHRPHRPEDKVFFGVLFDDKHRPRPSKMLSSDEAKDNVKTLTKSLKRFMSGHHEEETIPGEQIVGTLPIGEDMDFSPKQRIPSRLPVITGAFARVISSEAAGRMAKACQSASQKAPANIKIFPVSDFVQGELITPPIGRPQKNISPGNVPLISNTGHNNGISKWKDLPDNDCLSHCITISKTHNTKPCEAFWHPYRFSATKGIIVFKPIPPLLEDEKAIGYLCEAITKGNAWKYDYANTVNFEDLTVSLPATAKGKPDYKRMAAIVRAALNE